MSKTIRIEVTADDILNGAKGSAFSCPIALAGKRAMPGMDCGIASTIAWYDKNNNNMLGDIFMPQEARDFVHKFDSNEYVAPFTFEIEID